LYHSIGEVLVLVPSPVQDMKTKISPLRLMYQLFSLKVEPLLDIQTSSKDELYDAKLRDFQIH
jgi:hypothetical protein